MSKTSKTEHEIQSLTEYIESIGLEPIDLPEEFYYPSLPLCIIDSVFSIGVRYASTQKTVKRFCESQDWNIGPTENRTMGEKSISDLLECFSGLSSDAAAKTLFGNRQRTSAISGILKAEAVQLFAKALLEAGIQDFPDLTSEHIAKAKATILTIRGQKSGISFDYFLMLAGDDNLIKPDRRVKNFIAKALGIAQNEVKDDQARILVQDAVKSLNKRGKSWSARRLDYAIWDKERTSGK